MRILIDDLPVIFPYPLVFNEQQEYMRSLKHALDNSGHALLQMPTGTGKTICLLALLTAYLSHRDKFKKVIYCTRTVVEMEKTLHQLKRLLKKRKQDEKEGKKFLCLGLTAKKNLCIHKDAKQWRETDRIQGQCKKRTAEWARNYKNTTEDQQTHTCQFYENFQNKNEVIDRIDDHQVFTMQELRKFGRQQMQCPYFTARKGIEMADIIVFNYLYLLDPQISSDFIKKLAKSKNAIVVFDEAHNIDDVCIEAYTLKINNHVLTNANQNVKRLENKLDSFSEKNTERYKHQLTNVLNNIREKQKAEFNKDLNNISSTALVFDKEQMAKSFIPESITNNKIFISSIFVLIQFFRNKIKQNKVRFYDNSQFRKEMELNTNLEPQFFKLSNQTLNNLLNILQVTEVQDLKSLKLLTFFCELVFTYNTGFKLVFQPHPMDGNIADPLLTLSCLDCSLCLQPVWKSFPSVILTSGTISPIAIYPKMLGFKPIVAKSINIQIGRNPINPLIMGRTFDQDTLSSEYTLRSEQKVAVAYGNLLRGLSEIVPDGILCFFPSYMYMEHILKQWNKLGIIQKLLEYKYLFIEKKNASQTQESLNSYRKACDIGRGAIFLAIARGKIAEGVDFEEHYGRCVIMIGFPVQNSHDPVLLERIRFMVENKQIKDRNQFFEFDTMRQCAQCLGRVMRKKTDYGLMILADNRFTKAGKYQKLPQWIKKCLDHQNINVTYEAVFHISSNFFRKMGRQFILNEKYFKTKAFYDKKFEEISDKSQQKQTEKQQISNV